MSDPPISQERQQIAALQAKVSELEERLTTLKQQRIKYGPICLVCGAAEPCHLKDDPHSPCTFDPAPRELWDRCKEQKQRISELEERLVDYDAAASECEGQSVLTTLHALKQYGMQLEREKADLEVKLRQVEAENAALRAELAHSRREPCVWTENDSGWLETTCQNEFSLTDGSPAENGMNFCPYCGRLLKEQFYEE